MSSNLSDDENTHTHTIKDRFSWCVETHPKYEARKRQRESDEFSLLTLEFGSA